MRVRRAIVTPTGPTWTCLALACLVLVAAPSGAATADEVAALREQAFTALWSEDAPRARELFRAYLGDPGAGVDNEARRGLALACSWEGLQVEAAALYRLLLAGDPNDGDAMVGLGRALIWDNRLRDGWRTLESAGAMGSPETSRDAGNVMLTALDEYTAPLSIAFGSIWDSDDLDIKRLTLAGAAHIGDGRLLQVMPARSWYRQPGQPDADATRLGAGLTTGLKPGWTLHAYGWLDHFSSDGDLPATGAPLDWDNFGGDAWLTWIPAPYWRADLGAGSQAVETYLALGQHIARRQASLSVEHRLSRRWSAGLAGVLGDYTDDNRSGLVTARATWRREGRYTWQAGPVLKLLDFRIPYPGGYWAPDQMRSAALEASVRTRGRVVTGRLAGSVAREKETGADAITVGAVSGRVGWRFAADWLFAAEAGYSQSSFSSASGYNRTVLNLEVKAFF
jgi:hypothetical protein